MSTIKNTAASPRGINVRASWGGCLGVELAPGETIEAVLFDPGNPIYQTWQAAGQVDFGGALVPVVETLYAITNHAAGPRGFNGKDYLGNMVGTTVAPGATVEAAVFDPANPFYAAMQASGDIDFGGALTPA